MTKFTNGPAAGVVLSLRRAPLFLRVTKERYSDKPLWDALDQLSDEPKPSEDLIAYARTSFDGHVHIRRDRKAGGSGFFAMATYALVEQQPDDATMRDAAKWREWCQAQPRLEPKGAGDEHGRSVPDVQAAPESGQAQADLRPVRPTDQEQP